jgi:hypothetical protein
MMIQISLTRRELDECGDRAWCVTSGSRIRGTPSSANCESAGAKAAVHADSATPEATWGMASPALDVVAMEDSDCTYSHGQQPDAGSGKKRGAGRRAGATQGRPH